MSEDLDRRRSKIRERQLLLALEQWAPAYQQVAGGWLGYECDITDATAEERTWLERHVAENGMPDGAAREWHEVRRAQGRAANAAATAAYLAGAYARAYGAMTAHEWERLHAFIAANDGAAQR